MHQEGNRYPKRRRWAEADKTEAPALLGHGILIRTLRKSGHIGQAYYDFQKLAPF